jgi:hypothetical protein
MKQEFIMTKLVTNEALSHVDSDYIKNQTNVIARNEAERNDEAN